MIFLLLASLLAEQAPPGAVMTRAEADTVFVSNGVVVGDIISLADGALLLRHEEIGVIVSIQLTDVTTISRTDGSRIEQPARLWSDSEPSTVPTQDIVHLASGDTTSGILLEITKSHVLLFRGSEQNVIPLPMVAGLDVVSAPGLSALGRQSQQLAEAGEGREEFSSKSDTSTLPRLRRAEESRTSDDATAETASSSPSSGAGTPKLERRAASSSWMTWAWWGAALAFGLLLL